MFKFMDLSVFEGKNWQNVQFESWFDSTDTAKPSPLRQPRIFHVISANIVSSQMPQFSSGVEYSGQSNLANLIISVMSCVVLITDGTNEFIIEEYNISFILDRRVFAWLQRNMWLLQGCRPMTAFRTCGTFNIYNKMSVYVRC